MVPKISSRLNGPSDLICAGAATNWVFPAILGGTYYPDVYNSDGGLRSDLTSFPDQLSDAGYATGGFIASNPYLFKWANRFDVFWNANLSCDSGEWYSSTAKKWLSRGYRTLLWQKRVFAEEIAQHASEWYRDQDSPRFLWMHLMEPHSPYYPGRKKAQEVGLVDAYRSVISYQRQGDETSSERMAVQRELYNKCVERFDQHVPDMLDFVDDDAMILAFADHGEEFNHGHYDHERLYDECVRVPLYHKNVSKTLPETVRQIDLTPTLLDSLDLDLPSKWAGREAHSLSERPAFMITPEPGENLLHMGIRTDTEKIIRSFNRDTMKLQQTQYYDVKIDHKEKENNFGGVDTTELEEALKKFALDHKPALNMTADTGLDSAAVESRLENLGYK